MQHEQLSYSIEEVAALTSIGRTSLYAHIAAGKLVARKAGPKRTVVTREDLAAFLASLPSAIDAGTVRKSA